MPDAVSLPLSNVAPVPAEPLEPPAPAEPSSPAEPPVPAEPLEPPAPADPSVGAPALPPVTRSPPLPPGPLVLSDELHPNRTPVRRTTTTHAQLRRIASTFISIYPFLSPAAGGDNEQRFVKKSHGVADADRKPSARRAWRTAVR